ncbi:alpha/beta fold hydrolase [Nocardia xishanensis]|uniref:alpha/beta fold hydrolase n=1 Tax=Nocardia xishanensis TaxID=238964 RepID=UPI0033DA3A82
MTAPEIDTVRVTVDGVGVRVRVRGPVTAPPLLLLHGIGRSLEDWQAAQDLLADRFHVIAMDLPGFGFTEPLPTRPDLRSFARAAYDVLDALGEPRPVTVLGNSLGGAVAMTMATTTPSRVAGLVLVCSAGFGREQRVDLRPTALAAFVTLPVLGPRFRRWARAATETANRRIFADPNLMTEQMLAHSSKVAARPGYRRHFLATGRSIALPVLGFHPRWRRRLLDAVRAAETPVFVVWGLRDRILPAKQYWNALRLLPNARGHLFPESGHMPQLEQPGPFTDTVRDFLDRVGATAASRRSS